MRTVRRHIARSPAVLVGATLGLTLAVLPVATATVTASVTVGAAVDSPVTTTVPPGCPLPPVATAVFVGEVVASDVRTARFRVEQVRAGSLEGFEVGGLVDVDYEDEVRFLDTGGTYLVGVAPYGSGVRLESRVREPAPLFGGNQVAGLDDVATDCPRIEDPVRTLMPDGTPVESGVIAPMLESRADLVRALVLPAVWVFVGLVVLAAVKNLLWASGREFRMLTRRRRDT